MPKSFTHVFSLIFIFFAMPFQSNAAVDQGQGLRVHEITMATPDTIAVEVRDAPFERGGILELEAAVDEPVGSWIRRGDAWAMVVGPQRRHLRLADVPPEVFLDRMAFDDPHGYRLNGQARVVSVYRKSMPYSSGLFRGDDGQTKSGATFKHILYLKLDQALEPGEYRLEWPDGSLPSETFNFDPLKTRALALRATQVGHAPADVSKTGYLSLWLPAGPNNGAVDFGQYGIKTFSVIDDEGTSVFSGPVRLRTRPSDPEPGNGLPAPLVDYAAGTPRQLEGFRPGPPPYVEAAGHGLVEGQRILFHRLQGDQDASALAATVGRTDEQGFAVTDIEWPFPEDIAPGATFTPTYKSNRAGTFVFELDYSQWTPQASGRYRLAVPGMGVSDHFEVATDRWLRLAGLSFAGLYHHRSGIPLDGRFGYERPSSFHPGSGLQILESALPLLWSSNWPNGFLSLDDGLKGAWNTGREASEEYWGGYMDAGDWDRRIQHLNISDAFLDLWEQLPQDKRAVALGIPKSSEVLPLPEYAGLDGVSDLIHEAIWNIDFYRRLQMPDGRVRGGVESAGHPLLGTTSYLEHLPVYAYAPDIVSTYRYAASASRLSRILAELNLAELAGVYRSSALAAWQAAEGGFSNPDDFYREAIAAANAMDGWGGSSWEARKPALQAVAAEFRAAAAASLFRLEGGRQFAEIFEAGWRDRRELYFHKGDAAWDYYRSAGADPVIQRQIEETVIQETNLLLSGQSTSSYPSMKHPYAPAGWGQGGPPDFSQSQLLFRAYQINPNPEILSLIQQTLHGLHGANQLGLSFTTGLGVRQIEHPLHEDHRAMGVPAPVGITIYGWAPQSASAYGWVFGPEWSPLPEVGDPGAIAHRRVEPQRFALPYFEYLVEHPAVIIQQEYTVDQTIGPIAFLALFLDAQSGR